MSVRDFWASHSIASERHQPGNPIASGEHKASHITQDKAKQMLKDNSAHGHPLTPKQKGLFGLIAGGGHPSK